MEFLKNFFRDNAAESNIRLATIIVVVNACGIAWYGSIAGKSVDLIVLGMLGLVLTAKVVQKTKE